MQENLNKSDILNNKDEKEEKLIIKTIEQYDQENAKLESFIDLIVKKIPNSYSPFEKGFWPLFGKTLTDINKELKNKQSEKEIELMFKEPRLILSGGSHALASFQGILPSRLSHRHAFYLLASNGSMSECDKATFLNAMPNWDHDLPGSGERQLDSECRIELLIREIQNLDIILKNTNIEQINETLKNLHNQYCLFNRAFRQCVDGEEYLDEKGQKRIKLTLKKDSYKILKPWLSWEEDKIEKVFKSIDVDSIIELRDLIDNEVMTIDRESSIGPPADRIVHEIAHNFISPSNLGSIIDLKERAEKKIENIKKGHDSAGY